MIASNAQILLFVLSSLTVLCYATTPDAAIDIKLLPSDTVVNYSLSCRGAFFCRFLYEPYSAAKIRLISNIKYIDEKPNVQHIVDGTEAYEDGSFELEGENRDATTAFEPLIVVYHQCGQLKRKNSTYRRFAIKVPTVYINSNETFDIGRINLDLFYPGQKDGIKFERFTKPLKVSGELFCNDQPEVARIIRMFSSLKQDSESFIAEEILDGDLFHIDSGRARLDEPILQINHQCDMSYSEITKGLYRQFVTRIPFFYYNAGRVGLREYNVGKLSLHLIYPGEVTRRLSDH